MLQRTPLKLTHSNKIIIYSYILNILVWVRGVEGTKITLPSCRTLQMGVFQQFNSSNQLYENINGLMFFLNTKFFFLFSWAPCCWIPVIYSPFGFNCSEREKHNNQQIQTMSLWHFCKLNLKNKKVKGRLTVRTFHLRLRPPPISLTAHHG